MPIVIFDKTDKGRDEIITRKYRLASRLRTLLVMVDGKITQDELLSKVAGLGLNQLNLDELVRDGFIQEQTIRLKNSAEEPQLSPNTQINTVELFQVLADFYTKAIKDNLGLRGHTLQVRVDHATTLQEFYDMRAIFLDAINKTQGDQRTHILREQLDEILNIMPVQFRGQV